MESLKALFVKPDPSAQVSLHMRPFIATTGIRPLRVRTTHPLTLAFSPLAAPKM